jgi:hypothetical protein
MKAYGGVDAYIRIFLTSVVAGSGQLHVPTTLLPGKDGPGPSGRRGKKKILDPTGTRTPTPRSYSP